LDADVESKLRGTTLRVYWHLVRAGGPVGVRQLQRELGLSSPSVAAYHLNKLVELGLVRRDRSGNYTLGDVVSVGVLRSFVKIGRFLLPRFLFYAAYFLTLLLIYTLEYATPPTTQTAFAVAFGVSGLAFSVYEAYRAWTEKPV